MLLLSYADFFQNKLFSKNSFKNTIRVSNGLDSNRTYMLLVMIWIQTVAATLSYQHSSYLELADIIITLFNLIRADFPTSAYWVLYRLFKQTSGFESIQLRGSSKMF